MKRLSKSGITAPLLVPSPCPVPGLGVVVSKLRDVCLSELFNGALIFVSLPGVRILMLNEFLYSPLLMNLLACSLQRLKDEIAEVTSEIENLGSTEER